MDFKSFFKANNELLTLYKLLKRKGVNPMLTLPPRKEIAAFDIDCQQTFTPLCPNELPVVEGDQIVNELNKQAEFACLRIASRDAHSMSAVWITDENHPIYSPVENAPDADIHWPPHAIIGTKGFDFIPGLDPKKYNFQVYKGVEVDKHPYGACYHDLKNTLSTGAIEYLRAHSITTVICGGLATDYCVKNTVLQLLAAGFKVILNLAACRGIAKDTTDAAIKEMQQAGAVIIASSAEFA